MTVTDLWIALPLLILAAGSLTVLLLGAIVPGRYGTVVGTVTTTAAAVWTLQTPPATTAPTLALAATPLARMFVVLFCLSAAATLLLAHRYCKRQGITGEEFPATVLFAAFGMSALAMATNLLILFMGLEAMTFGFYIMVAMDLRRTSSAEAGLKYLLTGAVAASFLAFGIGLLYAGTGSLATVDALRLAYANPIALAGWGFILTGVAFKLSLAPLHLWTPDVYQGAPAPVTAFLSAGSKAATIAALLLLLPPGNMDSLRTPLGLLAFLSMTVGNLAALLQPNIRRMLGYSSIAQMGYVTLALISGAGGGYRAAAYYAIAYSVMSLAAFGAITLIECDGSTRTADDWRGMGRKSPLTGGVLALALFALAGIPPTAGFTGKFLIFAAALKSGETMLAIIGILTAAVSVYYYLRVVVVMYLQQPADNTEYPTTLAEAAVLTAVCLAILAIGIYPTPLLRLISAALP